MNPVSRAITRFIDLFYIGPIRRIVPVQTFRYAFCGAANVVCSWVLYFISYHYVFDERDFVIGELVITPHIAALILVFPITFFTGFLLNKYIAFKRSPLRGRTQLMRYALSVAGSFFVEYAFMKAFVEALHIFPTPSKMLSTCFVTVYSYLMQKYFTFRGCDEQ